MGRVLTRIERLQEQGDEGHQEDAFVDASYIP